MKLNLFQIILLGVFGLFALGGIVAFAVFKGSSAPLVPFTIWGELPKSHFEALLEANPELTEGYKLSYTYVSEGDFSERFVEALSENKGPDIILVSSDRLLEESSRILPISYEEFSQADFNEKFLSQTDTLYFGQTGLRGVPAVIDPMVLYANQSLLTEGGFVEAPKTWEELPDFIDRIVQFGPQGEITRAAIPLGSFENVENAKGILSSLLLQSGTTITERVAGELKSVLLSGGRGGIAGAQYALNFFTQFSDPSKSFYTWNSSLEDARTMFTKGTLALYPGFASEHMELIERNPNQDISLEEFPQARVSGEKSVFAKFYGWSITRRSEAKYVEAIELIKRLSSETSIATLSNSVGVAPSLKSFYGSAVDSESDFPGRKTIYESAVIAEGWEDPDPVETNSIFASMVNAVESGRLRITEAVYEADRDLKRIVE